MELVIENYVVHRIASDEAVNIINVATVCVLGLAFILIVRIQYCIMFQMQNTPKGKSECTRCNLRDFIKKLPRNEA